MLGLSVAEIRRRDKLGAFKPVARGKHGLVYYSRDAIVDYAKRSGTPLVQDQSFAPFSSEEANTVFAELEKGASMLQCGMRTNTHPAKVRAIVHEYELMTGAILLDAAAVKIINELPLDGPMPITKAADVVTLLESASKGQPCSVCTKRPRHLCRTCAIPFVRKQLEREVKGARRPADADDADEA